MKGDRKQKPRGTKHKIREEKKREERIGAAVTVAILIVVISVSGFFIHSMLSSSPQKQETSFTSEPKAAIVDHLSLTAPNQTFIQTVTSILKQAGYTVDYYPSGKVTVEFYRNLPTHGYDLIILRVHSSASGRTGQEVAVSLFTSERASTAKYVYEKLTDQLIEATFSREERERGIIYFGISPLFVTQGMRSRFQNTTIVMMGCEGLHNPLMAKAFIEKGARVYISWDKSVSASHTDKATTHLLQNLISQKQQLKQAIDNTMRAVGPDPAYNAILLYHPLEAGDYTIQNIKGSVTTDTIEIMMTQDVIQKKKNCKTRLETK